MFIDVFLNFSSQVGQQNYLKNEETIDCNFKETQKPKRMTGRLTKYTRYKKT
jgi:hypothetical protein